MRHAALSALMGLSALGLVVAPAIAQNAVQIAHARAGASCPRCNLFQADFADAELKGRNFAGARLRQADMSTATLTHSNFAGADMRDVNGYGAVFGGANLSRANLTNATFVGAYFQNADFRGASLSGVNFSGAELDRAIGLTQGQLAQACGDQATTLPRGLHLRPCA